jgi:hypothetical protein
VSNPDVCNITGGYVVGSFDLIDNFAPGGPTVVGEYRFMHEYDYMQDPEYHSFYLQEIDPSTSYYVSNIRFGHTYSFFDTEQLWSFDDWMTYSPTMQPLSAGVNMTLDWTGRLPYPQGENYRGEFQPPPCTTFLPQDYNRDCFVNFFDFADFAENWLRSTIP